MKSGKFTMNQILGLVLSIAVVFVLFSLVFSLFSPTFDEFDKEADGYFDSLIEEIAVADDGKIGEMGLWGFGDKDFFLIYFGDNFRYAMDGRVFLTMGKKNIICVCYLKEGVEVCDYCEDLGNPAIKNGKEGGWFVKEDEKVKITKKDKRYVFEVIYDK